MKCKSLPGTILTISILALGLYFSPGIALAAMTTVEVTSGQTLDKNCGGCGNMPLFITAENDDASYHRGWTSADAGASVFGYANAIGDGDTSTGIDPTIATGVYYLCINNETFSTNTDPNPADAVCSTNTFEVVDTTPTITCGDGSIDSPEYCDDGNTDDGDGCNATCTGEEGYTCSGEPSVCSADAVCGNDVLEGSEECDDGNTDDGDGCSATCTNEVTSLINSNDMSNLTARVTLTAKDLTLPMFAIALTVALALALLGYLFDRVVDPLKFKKSEEDDEPKMK